METVVGMPSKNPWSLPFLYKKLFFDRKEDYDLYIYSEDDTLITEDNIRAFMKMCKLLDEDEIPGFMRYEVTPDKEKYIGTVHTCFHWLPETLKKKGEHVFARYTNDHSACFVLTKNHLQAAIRSGGFMVEPHEGPYDMLCSAATDPYTRCGLKKYICLSDIDNFLLPHMPNNYFWNLGIPYGKFIAQVNWMISISEDDCRFEKLYAREPSLPTFRLNKNYYGELVDIKEFIPRSSKRVLSVGCGSGDTERKLVETGMEVTAIPVDHVMAALAKEKGIRVLTPTIEGAVKELGGSRFDCILFGDILQHLENPGEVIDSFLDFLLPGGSLLIVNQNCGIANSLKYFIKKEIPGIFNIHYDKHGIHLVNRRVLRKWLKSSRLKNKEITLLGDGKKPKGSMFNYFVIPYVIAKCRK